MFMKSRPSQRVSGVVVDDQQLLSLSFTSSSSSTASSSMTLRNRDPRPRRTRRTSGTASRTGELLLFASTLSLAPRAAYAWTDTGHMIVARIAADGLSTEKLEFFTNITDSLYVESAKAARKGTDFDKPVDTLWGAASWEDNIDVAFFFQKNWHFADGVIKLDDGCELAIHVDQEKQDGFRASVSSTTADAGAPSSPSAVWPTTSRASPDSPESRGRRTRTLSRAERVDRPPPLPKKQDVVYGLQSAYYGVVSEVSKWNDPAIKVFQQAFWLRSFIHFVGDLHQPLHAATGCSAAHPQGDRGGNLFTIQTDIRNFFEGHASYVKELHLLWDLGGGLYAAGPNWPLNATGEEFVAAEAQRLRAAYADKYLPQEVETTRKMKPVPAFDKFRNETYTAAMRVAYTDIKEDDWVTPAYISRAQKTSEERIALGGFRLQGFLERMYSILVGEGADADAKVDLDIMLNASSSSSSTSSSSRSRSVLNTRTRTAMLKMVKDKDQDHGSKKNAQHSSGTSSTNEVEVFQ